MDKLSGSLWCWIQGQHKWKPEGHGGYCERCRIRVSKIQHFREMASQANHRTPTTKDSDK